MAFQTINGKQIRSGSIDNSHIKGKLSENVLDIKWTDPIHAEAILKNKIITDYVQLNKFVKIVGGVIPPLELSLDVYNGTANGVLLNEPIRFRSTDHEVIRDKNSSEVIGKLVSSVASATPGAFNYTLKLYENDGTTAFTPSKDLELEILYPIKTTLWDAMDNFASNERFVDGAVDIRSVLDLEQLVADIFGPTYVLNAKGKAINSKTLEEVLNEKTSGTTDKTKTILASAIIDEVFKARNGESELSIRLDKMEDSKAKAIENLIKLFASNLVNEGASLIGVEDANDLFTAINVEGVLKEVGTEIKNARGKKATLTERLNVAIDENGILVDNTKVHVHGSLSFKLIADSTKVTFDDFKDMGISASLIKESDQIDVYVNGSLQAETFHYALLKADNFITGVDFNPELIKANDDIITIKWTIYNK